MIIILQFIIEIILWGKNHHPHQVSTASDITPRPARDLLSLSASHELVASAMLQAFIAGREWAVLSFAVLSAFALACTVARSCFVVSQPGAKPHKQAKEFAAFQRSYLTVYVVIMLADWMQGTHMYTLYDSYAKEEGSSVQIGTLFFTGFMAAGVLGTFTGPLVDKYGRKRACLVYVALEVMINMLEHVNSMTWLLVGRVLGGISTSLLFSAFEAWMVTEHRSRGFPEDWIGKTFGQCAVWNGATAIAAGFLAQVTSDALGDIGPFQLAIALTLLAGVLIMPWSENYGGEAGGQEGASAESSEGLLAAWRTVRASRGLLVVGAVYALFEGAMYTFVFNWVPTLAEALGGFAHIAPVQGLLFSCLMAAISIGGELYSLAFHFVAVEVIGVAIFALSCICMLVPVVCGYYGCGIHASFGVHFTAFLGFEMCVGAFQPCVATHRSKYVPDAQQSTVNNLFRFPLNMLVAAGTVLSDYLPPYLVFGMCASAHALATLFQAQLAISAAAQAPPSAASKTAASSKASAAGKAKGEPRRRAASPKVATKASQGLKKPSPSKSPKRATSPKVKRA